MRIPKESGPGASAPDAVTTMTVPTKSTRFNPLGSLVRVQEMLSAVYLSCSEYVLIGDRLNRVPNNEYPDGITHDGGDQSDGKHL